MGPNRKNMEELFAAADFCVNTDGTDQSERGQERARTSPSTKNDT